MAIYKGRDKDLMKLAKTSISQETFDFVVETEYKLMMHYIKEGPEKMLVSCFSSFFKSCPDLGDMFWEELGKKDMKSTILALINTEYSFFNDRMKNSIVDNYFSVELAGSIFLKALIHRIRKDEESSFNRNIVEKCQSYFDEIEECRKCM